MKKLRAQGTIPAVVYGHGFPTEHLAIERRALEGALKLSHDSPLIELVVDEGEPIPAVLQELQRDALRSDILHVDFHRLRMEEKLTTTVPLEFTGESLAVKERAGVLVKLVGELSVECLPADLVSAIRVDLGELRELGDHLRIKDLAVPAGIRVFGDPEAIVVTVQEARVEEAAPEKPEADVAAVEVVGKKKEEAGSEAEQPKGSESQGKAKAKA